MNFSMQRTNLQIFQKWHFFAIWSPDAPWSVRSLSANENSILFNQKIGRSNLERLISGFFIKLIISRPNVWKTASKYISASNGKFHPKGATSQRPKESASHHYQNLFKNQSIFGISIILWMNYIVNICNCKDVNDIFEFLFRFLQRI